MIIQSISLRGTYFTPGQLPDDGLPKIVFMGRSNVGKSSLLNRLLNRRHLARTSATPGKTVSVNYYWINNSFYFVDLPGYGYGRISRAEAQRVQRLIRGFLQAARGIRLIVLLVDARHGFAGLDLEMVEKILEKKFPILTVLTKSDKLSNSESINQAKKFRHQYGLIAVPFSIKQESGKNQIWDLIDESLKE